LKCRNVVVGAAVVLMPAGYSASILSCSPQKKAQLKIGQQTTQ